MDADVNTAQYLPTWTKEALEKSLHDLMTDLVQGLRVDLEKEAKGNCN